MSALDVVFSFYRTFNQGRAPEAMAHFAPSCVSHIPGAAMTQEEHQRKFVELAQRVPNVQLEAVQAFADDTTVMVFGLARGLSVEGEPFEVQYADWLRVENELIVQHQTLYDHAELGNEHRSPIDGRPD